VAKKIYNDDVAASIHEMASGIFNVGLMPKSTMREIDKLCLAPVAKMTPDEIKTIREEAHASQSVFAYHLNVTPLAVSQWERGVRSPSGPALKLLTLVKNKGLQILA